jgi:hypothetical protein
MSSDVKSHARQSTLDNTPKIQHTNDTGWSIRTYVDVVCKWPEAGTKLSLGKGKTRGQMVSIAANRPEALP